MADPQEIPQSREAFALIDLGILREAMDSGSENEIAAVFLSKTSYRFLSNGEIQGNVNTNGVAENLEAIDTNNDSIDDINADLVIIVSSIGIVALALATHEALTSAHGVLGSNVGTLNLATVKPGLKGVVSKALDVGDPTGTFVNLAAVEAWAALLRTNLQSADIMA